MNCVTRIFISLFFCGLWNHAVAQQKDFDTVARRIVVQLETNVNSTRLEKKVTGSLARLQTDGTWKDINYRDSGRALWSPVQHLNRVEDFALAYCDQKGSLWHNKTLYGAIVSALKAWNNLDPICTNWWYNEINCPQLLGQIMLLMQSSVPLPAPLQDSLLKKTARGDMYKETGANKLDVALHYIYSAVLRHSDTLMNIAVVQCFQPITLTDQPGGLQYDYSYLQHGPQLQIASYGSVFLAGEYMVAALVNSTRWQLSDEKRQILTLFLNRTFLQAIRYRYFDFSVLGRGFSRKNSGNGSVIEDMYPAIHRLKTSGTPIAGDLTGYDEAIQRASGKVPPSYHIKPEHTQFWKGDYTQHVRPEYLFTVRANSNRTCRTETGNGENLYGRYMSDGATNIQCKGDEYFNIFPVWEYDKIPGVTCRDYVEDRPAVNSWNQPGTTDFTGGVSDGLNGVSTYTLNFDSVKARKAWFFFDRQIVCMGAGIESSAPEHITTTVNQCWSRGRLIVNQAGQQAYWQDSIGYYFQSGLRVLQTNSEQKGTWHHINSSQSKDTVTGKVFKLWIDHGIRPQNSGYVYAIVPGISAKQFGQQLPFSDFEVISNTAAIQAVRHAKLDVLQAVFYEPGILQAGKLSIHTDQACTLMIRNLNSVQPELYIADPTQKLREITIHFNDKEVRCVLPDHQYAGSSARYLIK